MQKLWRFITSLVFILTLALTAFEFYRCILYIIGSIKNDTYQGYLWLGIGMVAFIIVAAILTVSIILAIINIDRLAKMSDDLLSLTARLNGNEDTAAPTYRRGKAYWTGIVMVALCLVGLVFKLMHWPFANLISLIAGVSAVVFVLLTGRHLVRIVPEERPVIRIAEVAGLFLVANAACKLFHWPFGNLFGLISVLLLLTAALVYWLRQRRRKA